MKSVSLLVINKLHDQDCRAVKCLVISTLEQHYKGQMHIYLDSQASLDETPSKAKMSVYEDRHQDQIDFAISIGGDGTLLYLMKKFQRRPSPPTWVFSMGTLGFLCIYDSKRAGEEMQHFAHSLNQGAPLHFQQATRIRTRILNHDKVIKQYHCLNQVSLVKWSLSPVSLRLRVENKDLTLFKGDGLIVSTPTGSTGYALSAGGPILAHQNRSLLVVPVSPHSLSFRPVVLPDSINLSVEVVKQEKAKVSWDGQDEGQLGGGKVAEMRLSEYPVNLIMPRDGENPTASFLERTKVLLQWNKGFGSL